MRILDEENDKALNGLTLYLTMSEASELKDSLEAILADPIGRHEHVTSKDGSKEITVCIYDMGGLDQFDDRSKKLITDDV
jgi:hypothetical protein